MNIIVANDFAYVNGGASKIALGSARALAALGHNVTLFTAVGPVATDLFDVAGLNLICLDQHEVVEDPNRVRAVVQGFWNRTAAKRMGSLLADLDRAQTVVHIHVWTKALSSSVIRTAIDMGFSVVVTLHDYFVACPAGTLFNDPKQNICHLRPMSAKCIACNCDTRSYGHKLWRVGRQWTQNHLGQLPSGVKDYISISDLSEAVLKPLLPPGARIHRVSNFIDLERQPAVNVAANTQFTFSGRFSPEKGPLLLAACSRELRLDVRFIGDGPLREDIRRLAPQASITGWLSFSRAMTLLGESRALVFPSIWYETQGLVVAEAAAIGVPSIVPDTCAAREWVTDGVTGLLFRGGDVGDLENKISYLKQNPSTAAAMGKEAYSRYWQEPATVETHSLKLEKVYESILAPLSEAVLQPAGGTLTAIDSTATGRARASTRRRRSPRVLHVLEATLGGTLHYLRDIIQVLPPHSHEMGLVYATQRADPGLEPTLEQARSLGWQTFPLKMVRPVSPSDDLRSAFGLHRILREYKPDILHCHSSKAGALGRIARLGLASRPHVLYSPHSIAASLGRQYLLAERLLSPLTDRFGAVSKSEASEIVKLGLVSPEQVDIIYPFIDTAFYQPRERAAARASLGFSSDQQIVLACGRLAEQKNPLLFVEIISRMVSKKRSLKAVWVGDGAFCGRMKDEIRRLGLEGVILLPGWQQDVRPYIAAADVVLSTSRYESFGYTVAEALAMERPVVATAIAGTSDIMTGELHRLLYPAGDGAGGAEAVLALLDDPFRAQSMGRVGRVCIETNFSQRRMAQALTSCYESLLSSKFATGKETECPT